MTLADAIMFKAWKLFELPELTWPFLDHVALRLRQYGDLCRGTDREAQEAFVGALQDDVERRRQFLTAVCAGTLDRIEVSSYRRSGFLVKADLPWLLDISPGGLHPVAGLNPETICNFLGALSTLTMAPNSRCCTPPRTVGPHCGCDMLSGSTAFLSRFRRSRPREGPARPAAGAGKRPSAATCVRSAGRDELKLRTSKGR